MAVQPGLEMVPGNTALGAIRLSAQQRSGQQKNGEIPQDSWTQFVLDSLFEMHAEIVASFGDNYKIQLPSYSFVTDGTTTNYPLPKNFYKTMLVEWAQTPGVNNSQPVTLQRTNFTEKNRWNTPYALPTFAGFAPYYIDVADTLLLVPTAQNGMQINLWYIPRNLVPYESGVISLGFSPTSTQVLAGAIVTINGVSFAAGSSFAVGANDAATATNLVAAINASGLSRLLTASNLITATQTTNDVTITLNNFLVPAKIVCQNKAGTIYFAGVYEQQTVTVNDVIFTCTANGRGKDEFAIGATDALTAQNFAAAFNASGLNGVFRAFASSTTVTITNPSGLALFTNPAQSFSFSPSPTWTNKVDGINGWERLVVADVIVKALAQLEIDTSPFEREKAGMIRRLQNETKNRDAGSPKTMVDVRFRGGGYGMGGGSGGY